jgi:tetratricopeptide (TPR) repeat protein
MTADLRTAERLEGIRLGDPQMTVYAYDRSRVDPAYAAAFKDYGIDVATLDVPSAADRIRADGIRAQLIAALDDWMWAKYCKLFNLVLRGHRAPPAEVAAKQAQIRAEYERLRAIADLVAPEELCRRIRDPDVQKDRRALEELAGRPEVAALPASTAMILARLLAIKGAKNKALAVLYAVRQRPPDDFLVNYELAMLLDWKQPARLEEAIGFLRTAAALRPQNPTLHLWLGRLLGLARRPDQAVASYRRAFELQPSNAYACSDLGKALGGQGKWDEAIAVYAQFLALRPENPAAHHSLGQAYRTVGKWGKAIVEFRAASRLAPNVSTYQQELAWLLATSPDPGLRDAAQAVERAAKLVQTAPKSQASWKVLGVARYRAKDWKGAISALGEANRLSGGGSGYEWFFLAMAHRQRGEWEEACRWYDRAVRWMVKNAPRNEELRRFRTEAAQLLGVEDSAGTGARNPPPRKR